MPLRTLDIVESMKIVEKYGIKFAHHKVARNEKELESACKKIGFPVAVKIISTKISHKTERGGVEVGIKSIAEAHRAFRKMKKLTGFGGVVVQKMVKGTEIIIGGKRDMQFGPTVLVGLGGIFVEVFKDYAIGICPITRKTATEMISELKALPIIKGYRTKKAVNMRKLEEAIMKAGKLMQKEKKIQEIDLNPLIGNKKEVVAVDARVVTG